MPAVRHALLAPLCLTGGILVLTYASHLAHRTAPKSTSGPSPTDPAWLVPIRTIVVGVLVSLGLFWSVADYAGTVGDQLGDRILAGQAGLPSVVLFTPHRLHVDGDGVVETDLQDPDGAYRFRYDGLEFLERTGGRLFLRPRRSGRLDRLSS